MPIQHTHTSTYIAPLVPGDRHPFQLNDLEPAVHAFESGNVHESLRLLFNTLHGSELIPKTHDFQKEAFTTMLTHGSLTLHVTINETELTCDIPLVERGDSNTIALLRKALMMNVDDLALGRIEERDNILYGTFKSSLQTAHPHKLYFAISELCENLNYQDDVFVKKYGCTRVEEAKTTPIEKEVADKAIAVLRNYLQEALERTAHFEQKNHLYSAILCLSTVAFRVKYIAQPRGYATTLINDLDNLMHEFFNRNGAIPDYLPKARTLVQKLLDLDEETLRASLYIPTFFTPNRQRVSATEFVEQLKAYVDGARNDLVQQDYSLAVIRLENRCYDLLYHQSTDEALEAQIHELLQTFSNLPWGEAAEPMVQRAAQIVDAIALPQQPQASPQIPPTPTA